MHRFLALWASTCFLAGCVGHIVLSPLDASMLGNPPVVEDINSSDGKRALDEGYNGIVVYLPKQVIEVDRFTQRQRVAEDGNTLILSGDCDMSSPHAEVQKVVTVVDRDKPYLLQYRHGLLESYNFSATLTSDGALASVNTTSNPDQGKTLANLSSAAVSAAKIAAAPTTLKDKEPCTQTLTFQKYIDLPSLPKR